MKKIFKTLLVVSSVSYMMLCQTPAFSACKSFSTRGGITGSACSVSELKNSEEGKQANVIEPKGEKNLRPVKNKGMLKPNNSVCLFRSCLYQSVLEK